MRIPIDRESNVPLYKQIQQFLQKQIESGTLTAEMRLPASRELAADLGISRLTVVNAYTELEVAGLIYSLHGSGTFVASPAPPPTSIQKDHDDAWPRWQQELRQRAPLPSPAPFEMTQSRNAGRPLIHFAAGMGNTNVFSMDAFRKSLRDLLREEALLGNGAKAPGEYAPLQKTVAEILTRQGIPTHSGSVLITTNAQQALSLTAQLLLKPGDGVLVENPTRKGALELFQLMGARLLPAPVDNEGMSVEKAEEILRLEHPSMIYTMPTFHNPTGVSMSMERRRKLVALAQHYNVPIVEDDSLGDLGYSGPAIPALKTFDPGGHVLYINAFSKALVPGIHMGVLVATGPVYEQLLARKQYGDEATPGLMQQALDMYLTAGRYEAHIRRLCRIYRRRRNAMLQALERYMPPGVCWQRPHGGLFIWLKLPQDITAEALFPVSLKEGVTFAPGSGFFPDGRMHPHLRLNFTANAPDVIDEGIKRLAAALEKCILSSS